MRFLDQGNTFLAQGEASLSQSEQVLADYSNQIAPQSAISNTGWTLLIAAAIGVVVILYVK